jgi:hypothetical protein
MNDIDKRIERLAKKVKGNPSQKMHQRSENFWERLKIKRRTSTGVEYVEDSFARLGVRIIVENHEFGKEPKDEWVYLQYWDIPVPADPWFEQMTTKVFENEQEVYVFFLSPLFSALGYQEEDFSFEYPVRIPQKFGKPSKYDRPEKVDLVLFEGTDRSPENILVVCEAKKPDDRLSKGKKSNLERAEQESLIYCLELHYAKRRVATNGDVLKIYKHYPQNSNKHALKIHRSEFYDKWQQLYFCLGKLVLCAGK